jgi:hypothetical protein
MPTRRSGVGRVYLLATMTVLAAFGTLSRRVALAEIPEAPGTFTDSNGAVGCGTEYHWPAPSLTLGGQSRLPNSRGWSTRSRTRVSEVHDRRAPSVPYGGP